MRRRPPGLAAPPAGGGHAGPPPAEPSCASRWSRPRRGAARRPLPRLPPDLEQAVPGRRPPGLITPVLPAPIPAGAWPSLLASRGGGGGSAARTRPRRLLASRAGGGRTRTRRRLAGPTGSGGPLNPARAGEGGSRGREGGSEEAEGGRGMEGIRKERRKR